MGAPMAGHLLDDNSDPLPSNWSLLRLWEEEDWTWPTNSGPSDPREFSVMRLSPMLDRE